ncbi:hypothetical protein Taro_013364 [Colocasia esculenta]
MEKKG